MKTVNQTVNNATKTPMVALTENEKSILTLLAKHGTQNGGDVNRMTTGEEGNMFLLEDCWDAAKKELGKNKAAVKGTIANLQKKGMVKCYNCDGYFDGEFTDEGIKVYSTIIENDKVTKSNNVELKHTDMNVKEDSVMDCRIVKLNDILSKKLSAVSKGKRESLKAAKVAAKYLLENWDNEENLTNFSEDKEMQETQYELYCVAKSRIDQFKAKREEEAKRQKEAEMLAKKKSEDAAKKDTPKNKKAADVKGNKSCRHQVGDLHPNGKWVWTEYKPGKFDWRGVKTGDGSGKSTKSAATTKVNSPKKESKKSEFSETDFLERCHMRAKDVTKSQKDAKKLLMKGYKVEKPAGGNQCFLKKVGETNKSFDYNSILGLFRKLGYEEIPAEMFMN